VKKIKSQLRFATRLMARAQEQEEGKGASAYLLSRVLSVMAVELLISGLYSLLVLVRHTRRDPGHLRLFMCQQLSCASHTTSLTFTLRLSAHHPLSYCELVHDTRVTVPLQYTCQSTHQTCHASVSSSLTPLTRSSRPVYPSTSNTPKKQSSMVCPPSRPRASARHSSRPLRRLLRSIRNGEGQR
jgi:hypothetical protein